MNSDKNLKRLGLVFLLAFVGLTGCKEESANPLIGIWQGTFVTPGDDFTVTVEFKEDGTFTETIAEVPVTFSGTYVDDSDAQTITTTVTATSDPGFAPIGYIDTSSYSFSDDNNTITVTSANGTGYFTRQ